MRDALTCIFAVFFLLASLLGASGRADAASFRVDISPAGSLALNSTNYSNGDHAVGLSALNAVGQPASPATGDEIGAGIIFDDVSNQLSFSFGYGADFGFVDLLGDYTVAHIHGPAAVQFPSPNPGAGIAVSLIPFHTAGSSARTGSFSGAVTLNATQETQLLDNLLYINIHSGFAGGGEIRGQLVLVPEPSTALLIGGGLWALGLQRRRPVRAAHRRA